MPTDIGSSKPTVLDLATDLANERTTSRELVEIALARITDPAGEGARTFVKVYAENARAAADAQDRLRKAGYIASPLAGLPVSLKDLFDVSGERTLAGSKALDDSPPAERDAPIVAPSRGRRCPDRSHEYDRVCLFRRRYQSALWYPWEFLRSATDTRRIVIGCGCVSERWWRCGCDRNRYWWLGSHPSRSLRHRRV
jgi:hypothetical protein